MTQNKITKVQKRDGTIVDFDAGRITDAIFKAITATGQGDGKKSKRLSKRVVQILNRRFRKEEIPQVEQVQDVVEEVLISEGLVDTAKAYILYREQRRRIREAVAIVDESTEGVDKYLQELDWQVHENANMAYSLQGLNQYTISAITKKYWLNKIYPKEIREAAANEDFHVHNLETLAPYCMGWDLYDLLLRGFGGVVSKIESRPAKHLRTALGQLVNFLFTLQGESAGANAVSNFDTLLAPFIKYDNLNYSQAKQAIQEFLYNCMVPTRVGFQTPFLNVSLDIKIPEFYKKQPVIIGGKPQKETYGEFQEEVNVFNRAFYECLMEGDAKNRPFTFPIPTVSIGKDFDWDDPNLNPLWEATAKYGVNYFSNFIHSDMKPDDARSMCCRLRLDNRELYKRGGGLFGSNPSTGSVGVVTVNLPRIGYLSKTKKEFFERLGHLMDLAKESLEIKRKALEDFMEKGLYPYSKHYLASVKQLRNSYFGNHFSTIGLMGMNEALLNFLGESIGTRRGRKFAIEVLEFMREKLVKYQKDTGNLYNLEATPGEGTSFRQARTDKEKYPDIKTAGTKLVPFYTNSSQLPVNYTDDIFEALKLQDDLQRLYTGGCVEKGNKVLTDKGLLQIENIVDDFERLKPIKALSYNKEKKISEWDDIVKAVKIDVKKHNKIRIKGERNLDITTSDWHPFFVLERFKPNPACPICETETSTLKRFANHIRWNPDCGEKYKDFPRYKVVEKRADELKLKDYILQNSYNLYPEKQTELNDDLAWLIGFFIGDGSISKFINNRGGNNLERYKVRFFTEHQAALEKVVKILNQHFDCEVKVIQNEKRSKLLKEVSTSKKEVVNFLFKCGFQSGQKVYNVFVSPKIKENLTRDNVFPFLGGLIDSDGHIGIRNGDLEYSTVSTHLAEDILEICTKAGIMVSKNLKKTKRKNEVDIWRIRIPQYEITKIKNQLVNTVHLTRIKESLSNRKTRYLPVVRVKEVSKVDIEDNQFYDLMTKKNHNYLAGKNCLVFIHNTVIHLFLGERVFDAQTAKNLVRKVFENFKLPYVTLTPTFSICPSHGYLEGEHFECPKCTIKQPCEVYSRVVGYLRPVQQWNLGKKQEFKERKEFKINTAELVK